MMAVHSLVRLNRVHSLFRMPSMPMPLVVSGSACPTHIGLAMHFWISVEVPKLSMMVLMLSLVAIRV